MMTTHSHTAAFLLALVIGAALMAPDAEAGWFSRRKKPQPTVTQPADTTASSKTIPTHTIHGDNLLDKKATLPPTWTEPMAKDLSLFEQHWLGHTFLQEPVSKRLERLETTIFGSQTKGETDTKRLTAIADVYKETTIDTLRPLNAPAEPVATPSISDQLIEPVARSTHIPRTGFPQAEALPEVENPLIGQLEQQLFQQTYQGEPLERRVGRLETQLFGSTTRGAMVDRVDRLRPYVVTKASSTVPTMPDMRDTSSEKDLPGSFTVKPAGSSSPSSSQTTPEVSSSTATSTPPTLQGAKPLTPESLADLEKHLLKQTFEKEPVAQRLDRLENQAFGRLSPQDWSDEQRYQRLEAIAVASRNGSIDSTKFGSAIRSGLPFALMVLMMLL